MPTVKRNPVDDDARGGGGYGRLAEAALNVSGDSIRYVLVDSVPVSLYYASEYLKMACPDIRLGSFYKDDRFHLDRFACVSSSGRGGFANSRRAIHLRKRARASWALGGTASVRFANSRPSLDRARPCREAAVETTPSVAGAAASRMPYGAAPGRDGRRDTVRRSAARLVVACFRPPQSDGLLQGTS